MLNLAEKKEMNFDFDISIADDLLTVHYHDETFVDLELSKYFRWIERNEHNRWINDFYNPAEFNGHGQETGYYDKEEYFGQSYDFLKVHLYEYLSEKKLLK